MPTRRALLRAGGAAALAALAGCQTVADRFRDTTTMPESSGAGEYRLDADTVAADDVPDGATVGVASPDLHELVADAASTDGGVDLEPHESGAPDVTLAFGRFEYVEFTGETYEPAASVASDESVQEFELAWVDDDKVGDDADVASAESLSDAERAAADQMLEDGPITVGRHEAGVPEGVGGVVARDYVRVDGDTYEPRVTIGDPPPHHMLALNAADPGDDAQVVAVTDEPPAADWSGVLGESVGSGTVGMDDVPSDEALVEYLRRVDFVVATTSVLDVSVTETVQ